MANISSARGTLTLSGDWAPEDIELANQVIRAWEFWGEFGLRTAGPLSLKSKRTKFEGTCRWSLADMLAEFDEWNRKWIAEPESKTDHPLSAEVYDGLLDVMFQKGLFIKISHQDKPEEGGTARGQGELVSDGKKMDYVLQFSKEERQWLKRQAAMKGVLYRYDPFRQQSGGPAPPPEKCHQIVTQFDCGLWYTEIPPETAAQRNE